MVSVQRCLCPEGVSVKRGSLSGGVSVQGSLSREVSVQGCLCPERESLSSGGSLSRGVSVQRGLCPEGVSVQRGLCQGDPHTVMCGRYASYWNAFLFNEIY